MREIYLDYAASAPIDPKVVKVVRSAEKITGNPSSFNDSGRQSRTILNSARKEVALFLGARPEEIIFQSSGSEANTLAIEGLFRKLSKQKKWRVITTPIEHKSVLMTLDRLEKEGIIEVDYLPVDSEGKVNPADVGKLIKPDTVLVSVMYINNEIGTIEPVAKIGKIIQSYRTELGVKFPLFHIDACQAAGYLPMNIHNLKADLVVFNGTKISGPKGTAVLFKSRHVQLEPLILGGGQEDGLRAGTENVAGSAGLAKAVSLIGSNDRARLASLQSYLAELVIKELPSARINGPLVGSESRAPHNLHISIPDLLSEQILIELDKHGVRAGSGSACTSRSVEPSHVLTAVKVPKKYQDGGIRLTIGRWTKKSEITTAVKVLARSVKDLQERYNIKS